MEFGIGTLSRRVAFQNKSGKHFEKSSKKKDFLCPFIIPSVLKITVFKVYICVSTWQVPLYTKVMKVQTVQTVSVSVCPVSESVR
jgi:hypothetical protein